MDRRHFLGALSALSAGMLLDPDRLLWVPGRTSYFDIIAPRWADHRYTLEFVDAVGVRGQFSINSLALEPEKLLGQLISISHMGGDDRIVRVTGGTLSF